MNFVYGGGKDDPFCRCCLCLFQFDFSKPPGEPEDPSKKIRQYKVVCKDPKLCAEKGYEIHNNRSEGQVPTHSQCRGHPDDKRGKYPCGAWC